METIKCPYCECNVRVSDVETDDGTCPECGAPLLGSLMMSEFDDEDEFDDDDVLRRATEDVEEDLDEDE